VGNEEFIANVTLLFMYRLEINICILYLVCISGQDIKFIFSDTKMMPHKKQKMQGPGNKAGAKLAKVTAEPHKVVIEMLIY